MTLARGAAECALQHMAAPPRVAAIPGSSAAAIAQAEDRARQRCPDYGRTFAHISRAVRQTMLLEAHIVEGPTAPRDPSPTQTRPEHRPEYHAEADPTPHAERLRREAAEHLDSSLAAYAEGAIPVEDLLQTISASFGLDSAPAETPPEHQPGTTQPPPHRPRAAPAIPGAQPQSTIRRPDRRR